MQLSDFAKDYLFLGLRINKHIDGYVEHYYGPKEIKIVVEYEEIKTPKSLLSDCKSLIKRLPNEGFGQKRANFLNKNLNAINTTLRILNGEEIPYLDHVELIFDFKPEYYEDNFFFNLNTASIDIYKGNGKLAERMSNYAKRRTVPLNQLRDLFNKALNVTNQKTKELFPDLLPEHEHIEVAPVKDQSWVMYNWYLGNYNSRIDVNISKTFFTTSLLPLACHEGYPGHHTERTVREKLLFRENNFFESCILLIYTPEMVISEGIGRVAQNVIFSSYESSKIYLDDFCLNPSLEDDIEILAKQNEIRKGILKLESNLAIEKYVNGLTDEELIKYGTKFELYPEKGIRSMLKFISDDLWAPYILAYQGERLITEKFGNRPHPNQFRRILTNQTLPSDIGK